MDSVWDWLESAGLERFYPKFRERGVNEDNFCELQFSDYDAVGVTDHADRQKLFKLIQVVRRELESAPTASGGPTRSSSQGGSSGGRDLPSLAAGPSPSGSAAGAKAGAKKASNPKPPARSQNEASEPPPAVRVASLNFTAPLPSIDTSDKESKIMVCVRKRPLSGAEEKRGAKDCIGVPKQSMQRVVVHEPKLKVDLTKYIEKHNFIYDRAFGKDVDNFQIYHSVCRPLVAHLFARGKVTCFAYGQTGSGKTYTMMGPDGGRGEQNGMYALAARDIFQHLPQVGKLEMHVSYFEIYGGKLFDLLNKRNKLEAREDDKNQVNIVNLSEHKVNSADELLSLVLNGNKQRTTGSTGANLDSSRSHAILQLMLKEVVAGKKKEKRQMYGKFSFIDLAGSERGADTVGNDRRTRLEGAEINKSLLALKECIRALDQSAKHRPFRGSKLTQVLKDSFVGNSRTVMIANVSPGVHSVEHTLNTLRYADRVKELKKEADARKDDPGSSTAYMPHQENRGKETRVEGKDLSDEELDEDIDDNDLFLTPIASKHAEEPGIVSSVSVASSLSASSGNAPAGAPASGIPSAIPSGIPPPGTSGIRPPGGVAVAGTKKSKSPHSSPRRTGTSSGPAAGTTTTDLPPHGEKLDQKQAMDLLRTHERICSAILEEEDDIVESHRRQIDDTMKLVKEEMQLLKNFDQLAFSVDEYVNTLDSILAEKVKSITALRDQIAVFKQHLREEEILSATLKGSGVLSLLPDSMDYGDLVADDEF